MAIQDTLKKNRTGNPTRRQVLKGAGCLIAATAFRSVPALSAQPVSSVTDSLSKYMSEASARALPDEVVEKAKHHILDTVAAMVSGSELKPGRAAIKLASAYGGEKVSTVVASHVLCGPLEAALLNGMLAHSDETDDSHAPSLSHPGCANVPAALALGEKFGIAGTHFLRAVTLGYDIGTRVTMTMGGPAVQFKDHKSTHAIAGVFGAAAAGGCAAKLNAQQMRWVLDYAGQQSAGIAAWQQDTDHIEKAFVFAGMPARSGATAALVVESGWTGIDDIFSGPDSFFVAYAREADPAGLIDKLGERYEITRTNIKKWTVGSPIQAPLDALELLRMRHPFETDKVQKVVVRIPSTEASVVDNRELPDICLQYMVAVMLIDKTASFHAAHDKPRMQDPAILRERAKVQLVPSEELRQLLPRREAIVEVTLTDGTNLTQRVEDVRGTAENPMERKEVVAKCHDLMAPVIGESACNSLVEKVLGLENVKDIRELRPLLQLS